MSLLVRKETQQSRARPTLKPPTDSTLNIVTPPPSDDRKRKRSESIGGTGLGGPFHIRPYPSSPFDQPLQVTPKAIISRASLPLCYLDSSSNSNELPNTRLFSARIPTLDALGPNEVENPNTYVVIAEIYGSSTLCAIERVQTRIYALCKLGDWVTINDLEKRSDVTNRPRVQGDNRNSSPSGSAEWWKAAAIRPDYEHEEQQRKRHKGHHIQLSSQPAPAASSMTSGLGEIETGHTFGDQTSLPEREVISEVPPVGSVEVSLQEVLNAVRVQYQDALYILKTSLAYFAKGPLSRARALVQQSNNDEMDVLGLARNLRSNILTLPSFDQKYQGALPEIIQKLPAGSISDGEQAHIIAPFEANARKAKRKKVGKDGLFPGEEEYVAKWWITKDRHITSDGPSNTRDQDIKVSLSEQRAREMQLQLILILEILALETPTLGNGTDGNPTSSNKDSHEIRSQEKAKKSKKPHDLRNLLGVLIDRLKIWQSMTIDEGKVIRDDTEFSVGQARNRGDRNPGSNQLCDFCAEVVIPFYVARLPDLCASICKELGGPTKPSPIRPRLLKASSTTQMPLKRSISTQFNKTRKPRRTLERVLTDEKFASRRPTPSLLRSTTDPVLPSLKREESEPPLSAISSNRGNIQSSKRYSQREVDLAAASHAAEAKLQKKSHLEQELKGAIAALKRPNPRMAVKELVESAEKRAAASGKSRKSRNPTRNPFAQRVQVTATPKGNRHKNIFGGMPRPHRPLGPSIAEPQEPEIVPPSSDPRIPSSTTRPPPTSLNIQEDPAPLHSPRRAQTSRLLQMIEQTPSRRRSDPVRHASPPTDLNTALEMPGHGSPTHSSPDLPPVKRDEASFDPRSPKAESATSPSLASQLPRGVQEAPSRTKHAGPSLSLGSSSLLRVQDSPVKIMQTQTQASGAERQEDALDAAVSIYKSLGWDDDPDELA